MTESLQEQLRELRPRIRGLRPRSHHRAEPWRDWAAIGLLNHAQLLAVALISPSWPWLLLAALPLGCTMATGTLTILHDAGHLRFARKEWPNVLAVQTAVPLGFWVAHWGLKHRVHHRASQVWGLDEATRSSSLVRLHPAAALRPVHRYQHLYTWLLYCLAWMGEMKSQLGYLLVGNVTGIAPAPKPERWRSFLTEKALCLLVLSPYAVLMGVGHLVLLWVAMMTVGSLVAAIVLVVGHINEGIVPPSQAPTKKDWARHLVLTTANFNTTSRAVRWMTGGMTHHLAHHLRPVAPRHELPALHDTVVRDLVVGSGERMFTYPTLAAATAGHYRRLRELGRPAPADDGEVVAVA
jgi:linoleoyl-CoA desaturase